MCKRKNFKRFLKIHEYIKSDNYIPYKNEPKFSNYYYKKFDTKLGQRWIASSYGYFKYNNKKFHGIILEYKDNNGECLFLLRIEKSGRIFIMESKIDQPAIFSAIYEIESIINNKKQKYKDNILEKLFDNIDEFSFKDRIFG